MEQILEKANKHYCQNLPFVVYKKPNEDSLKAFFQRDDKLYSLKDFTESGFVFASFDGRHNYIISIEESDFFEAKLHHEEISIIQEDYILPNELEKNNFTDLVAKGIQSIKRNEFKKVVLSRKETIALDKFDLLNAFQKLIRLYPASFGYCFFHPKIGIWMGATPELLIESHDKIFNTIALAGTQKDQGSSQVAWQKKEKEEQQYVTDYIVEKVKNEAYAIRVSDPYNSKAGTIWHIKTDISGTINLDSNLQNLLRLLHPTPAVCGLPKEKSKEFIVKNENYDRSFYTGFLGELNCTFNNNSITSHLFVNLRCMEIQGNKAHLYMGCGITKDSVPEKEWEESVTKSTTMKQVLNTSEAINRL